MSICTDTPKSVSRAFRPNERCEIQVSPSMSDYQAMQDAIVDAKSLGDDSKWGTVSNGCISSPGCLVGQLGEPMTDATRLTLLGIAIGVVLGSGAEEKMCRTHTRRAIAAMQDGHTCWDRADQDFPCGAMRKGHAVVATVKSPIAELVSTSLPIPAVVSDSGEFQYLRFRVTESIDHERQSIISQGWVS